MPDRSLASPAVDIATRVSSNRRTKTEGGQTFTYAHDRTDAIASQKIGADSALAFVYDSAGNVVTERTKGGVARTYVWDAADRLTKIDDPTGNDADLVYDPLDRVKTRTVGSDIQTFSYVGVTEDLWRQAGTTTSSGLLDADGARVGTKTGSTASWLLFDLLGSVAAAEGTSGTAITDALRYDAWGQTLGLYPATGSPLPTRFRGLVDLAPTADPDVAGSGSDPLYVMGARTYSPHTGAFTSLDTYAGSAIDPASLHRYLYAHANPITLIDPDGHRACELDPCEDTPPKEWVDRENAPPPAPPPNQSGSPDDRDSGTTTSTGTQTTSGGTRPPAQKVPTSIADLFDGDDPDRNPCEEIEQVLAISNHCAQFRWNYTDDIDPVVVSVASCIPGLPCLFGTAIVLQGKAPGPIIPPGAGSSSDDLIRGARNASSGSRVGSRWKRAEFEGQRVYQRDDLIDPDKVVRGVTNLSRMKRGYAPIGADGVEINLHHSLQTQDSAIIEITASMHLGAGTRGILHINPRTIKSGIDRPLFDAWKRRYWMQRACDFGGC